MHWFVGWDVGGWNCDRNRNSRDALAVLSRQDDRLTACGEIFRGNIRQQINEFDTLVEIINERCETEIIADDSITLAIDTPLGMSNALVALLTGGPIPDTIPPSYSENPYLFRHTEQWLFENEYSPLSAIKDMIGSQSTKAMHLLRKLGLRTSAEQCGVWRRGTVTAIEAYPTTCKRSQRMTQLFTSLNLELMEQDKTDAVYCALVAYVFATERDSLVAPQGNPSPSEGWIWIPVDAFNHPA